ncbi:DUF3311 domain-containing protein [Acidiferrobacter sp.]|jgi:hypothetical protein|uniref:DUF3311 domain-containing protein n=2 Tax=Acidiferrobacter sp. TaxID=1872107 RepID=UPI002637764F|nr:DUF3311 domain-containing protein [Acidiferrobacter sp.]
MSTSASRWAYLLLVIPFLGTLWVPLYNRVQPTVLGFPFFYWYQLAWVPVSVVLTGIVYRLGRGAQNSDEAGS